MLLIAHTNIKTIFVQLINGNPPRFSNQIILIKPGIYSKYKLVWNVHGSSNKCFQAQHADFLSL